MEKDEETDRQAALKNVYKNEESNPMHHIVPCAPSINHTPASGGGRRLRCCRCPRHHAVATAALGCAAGSSHGRASSVIVATVADAANVAVAL